MNQAIERVNFIDGIVFFQAKLSNLDNNGAIDDN